MSVPAASGLVMLSCFFHLVRRFWNQILTYSNLRKIILLLFGMMNTIY